jgi:hypothetical protein
MRTASTCRRCEKNTCGGWRLSGAQASALPDRAAATTFASSALVPSGSAWQLAQLSVEGNPENGAGASNGWHVAQAISNSRTWSR